MKNIFRIFNISVLLATLSLVSLSCNRGSVEEDDLPQEELSNIVLNVTDVADKTTAVYDYQVNGTALPNIKLQDGHTYDVSVVFLNGNEDATQEIKSAKDEHFLVYNFPKSDITLTRTDDASSTRKDGAKVGLKTRWLVNKAQTADGSQLILTLYHEPKTVAESKNGTEWGKQTGGETDAVGQYNIVK
ncbi:hypothetical protein M2T70_03700 [Elizabethkingia anophelis]|uniref:hypothetical protein n=1 Tax=Elizabethkingia TaxID=308865 RepID=UPI0009958A1C|nr:MULTISPECIES: hypothetical protein [Elizabethkingia]AQW98291.1 hypothetical protein BBD31_10475 [Elizabethkingia anophelis]AQX88852.1 hypothetical protein AYC67_07375 [Elizabethkingia anophelis]ASV78149.1 hypothetical protein A6J37_05685 [Elizabethkingia anophelis]EHM7982048.1 hypothetical protein [Elizabethkingia anophelis]EHM8030542.1 hypothetical protein [Elizabethkingia anophelis]